MPLILPVKGVSPQLGNDCYVAENATIVGDVIAGESCSFWFNSVVRGDVNSIRLGNKVNVQDNAVIHCTYQKAATTIGNNVSIGHNAIVHGCTIHDNVLIGMGAIVMDNCVVESNSIVAAGAILLEGTHVPSGSIGEIERIANNYTLYSSWFKQ
jgi:carbonic anhydrase/acetyltransferase-like protein (isoleucine patch superfamily)